MPLPGRRGRGLGLTAAIVAFALGLGCATPEPGTVVRVPAPPRPPAPEPVPTSVPRSAPETVAPEAPSAPARKLRVAAVGDIMLGARATTILATHGYDYPFVHVGRFLREADLAIGNLEGPLTEAGEPHPQKRYLFRSPPARVAPALASAGFDVLALANNHTMDYGVEGLEQTRMALDAVGIHYAGAGHDLLQARAPAIVDAGAHRVAVLAYSLTFPEEFWARADRPGTAFGHEEHIRADVRAARARADVVVVSFHWGREASTELRDYQPRLGRAAIDAGALIVLGHHPHVLQGIERYGEGIIFYSLGNFVFGSYGREAKTSIIVQLDLEDARLVDARLVPIDVNNFEVQFQPRPLMGERAEAVIAELARLSATLGTPVTARAGLGVVALGHKGGLASQRAPD